MAERNNGVGVSGELGLCGADGENVGECPDGQCRDPQPTILVLFLKKKNYLFIHERHREAETQAGSMWGAHNGARCQDPGITP